MKLACPMLLAWCAMINFENVEKMTVRNCYKENRGRMKMKKDEVLSVSVIS
jgi:hypothetical protein